MQRKKIIVADYAKNILEALPKGILLTSKAGDRVNSMTIGWGTLGIEWSTPIFVAFIREHRFTRELLDKNPEFTVNIPFGEFNKKFWVFVVQNAAATSTKSPRPGLPWWILKWFPCLRSKSCPLRWNAKSCTSKSRICQPFLKTTEQNVIRRMWTDRPWAQTATRTLPIMERSSAPIFSNKSVPKSYGATSRRIV